MDMPGHLLHPSSPGVSALNNSIFIYLNLIANQWFLNRYNSTIFSSISANAYDVFSGNGALNQTTLTTVNASFPDDDNGQAFLRLYAKAQNGTLHRLDNLACIDAYATAYQSTYGSLIVATDDVTTADNYVLVYTQTVFNPAEEAVVGASGYNWICQSLQKHEYQWQITPCITFLPEARTQAANNSWIVGTHTVDYCLVEDLAPHCKLQYSLPLVVIVIIFNLLKAIVISYVAFTSTDAPILTTGDAVASFLRNPDQFSRGNCLLPGDAFRRPAKYGGALTFDATPKRWRSALSRRRWVLGITLSVSNLSTQMALFVNKNTNKWHAATQPLSSSVFSSWFSD